MATTVEEYIGPEYLNDKHIVITGKHCMVRQMPKPTTWTHARFGIQFSISPDNPTHPTPPTFPASLANIELWIGFCKSGVNHPGLNPWTTADTHIGWKFGATAGPSGVGETFTMNNYSNGDRFYCPNGVWLWKVFNGVATGLTSNSNDPAPKAWKSYAGAKIPFFMEIADRGANWFIQTSYIARGSGGFDCGMHYGQFVKAIKSPMLDQTGLIMKTTDQAFPGRAYQSISTAQDNTRGRPDSIYVLFRDHNALGTRLIIHSYGVAVTA
jgi:hypothetical protein